MKVIVVNVETGERTERPYNERELAWVEEQRVKEAERAAQPGPKTLEERIAALEAKVL